MDKDTTDKILRELLNSTRENNEILRGLNSQRRWTNFFWFFKWFVIAALAYSAYLAATPYIDSAQQAINSVNNFSEQAKQLTNQTQNLNPKSFTDFITKEVQKRLAK